MRLRNQRYQEPRTILITGASRGLGASLALAYAKPEVALRLLSRNRKTLQDVADQCGQKGANVEIIVADVTDRPLMEQMLKDRAFDLVIANAGVSGGTAGQGVGSGESPEQIRAIFAANVDGVINTIAPVLPGMLQQGHGQIAIISSLASFRGLPSAPAYAATKAAVRVYGEGLRGLLRSQGIGVSVVVPGYIKTDMTTHNNFPMPLLMDADKAAVIIKRRLARNPARIAFPWPLYAVIWFLGMLPPALTDPIFERLPRKLPTAGL